MYWLGNPDVFAGSDEFTFIGKNIDKPSPSLSAGDKITVGASICVNDGFGNVTCSTHSANVISSTGSTQSKLGSCGVYIAPAAAKTSGLPNQYMLLEDELIQV